MKTFAPLRKLARGWNYVVRQRGRWPSFAIVAGLTLMMGIAATAAVFSLLAQIWRHDLARQFSPAVEFLLGMAFLVLLAACVNFARLLLARSAVGSGKRDVRSALGVSRGRIAALALIECVVLAALVGLAGIGFGLLGAKPLTARFFRHGIQTAPISSPLRVRPLIFAAAAMVESGADAFHREAEPGADTARARCVIFERNIPVVAGAYRRADLAAFYVADLPVRAHVVRGRHAEGSRRRALDRRAWHRDRTRRDSGVQEASCRRAERREHGECHQQWEQRCRHDGWS